MLQHHEVKRLGPRPKYRDRYDQLDESKLLVFMMRVFIRERIGVKFDSVEEL